MRRFVAFLRAINVGGRTAPMATLASAFAALGLEEVETFLASGNVIFRSAAPSGPALEARIERQLRAKLGFEVAVFVRSRAEVAAIAAAQPWAVSELATAAVLNVGFLKSPLTAVQAERLSALANHVDAFVWIGREFYWKCAVKQSQSKFSNAVFERATRVSTTLRSMSTLTRLEARLKAD